MVSELMVKTDSDEHSTQTNPFQLLHTSKENPFSLLHTSKRVITRSLGTKNLTQHLTPPRVFKQVKHSQHATHQSYRLSTHEKECSRDAVNHGLYELFFVLLNFCILVFKIFVNVTLLLHVIRLPQLFFFSFIWITHYPSECNHTRMTQIQLIWIIKQSDVVLKFSIRIGSYWNYWTRIDPCSPLINCTPNLDMLCTSKSFY